MEITLLHSPHVYESREIVMGLGRDPINTVDEVVTTGGRDIRIVGDHAICVTVLPNFGSYPTVYCYDPVSKDQWAKSGIKTLNELLAFVDAPGEECKLPKPSTI